jgi:hypothetical protein
MTDFAEDYNIKFDGNAERQDKHLGPENSGPNLSGGTMPNYSSATPD